MFSGTMVKNQEKNCTGLKLKTNLKVIKVKVSIAVVS